MTEEGEPKVAHQEVVGPHPADTGGTSQAQVGEATDKEPAVPGTGGSEDEPQPESHKKKKDQRCGDFYQLDANDRAIILGANKPQDVPLKMRNRLYAAINRFVTSDKITDHVLKQWEKASATNGGKFDFLVDWAKNTDGSEVKIVETHERTKN